MTNEIKTVFVYGTLKPELRYHYVAKQGGVFRKEEAYLEGFDLYHLEPENYPALVRGNGKVHGWCFIYQDIKKALGFLDELEGLHLTPPEYERVEALAYPSQEKTWVYLFLKPERLKEKTATKLERGVWLPNSTKQGLIPKGIE